MYIRSLVEQSVAVWNQTIARKDIEDIECVQKVALKIILKEEYTNYDDALYSNGLKSLRERREQLCLRFAKKCLKNNNTSEMIPLNPNFNSSVRNSEKI